MKARRKGTNEPFMEIELVTFAGSTYVDDLYNVTVKDLEFEQQQEPTSHWQAVREMAAIVAMQSFLSFGNTYKHITPEGCADNALRYADALVKKLKGE